MEKSLKNKLKWVLIGALIGAVISYTFTYIVDELRKKSNVEVYIETTLKQVVNTKYLPLVVENTGDFDLSNITIAVSTCDMGNDSETKYFEYYSLEYLRSHSSHEIQFANKETIEDFSRKDCSPYVDVYNRSVAGPFVIPYGLNETIKQTVVACGYCFYDVYFHSDKLNKTFKNEYFRSPIDLTFTVSPEKVK